MRVDVDEARQQPAPVDDRFGVGDRLCAQPVAVDPECALFPVRQDDSPYFEGHVARLDPRQSTGQTCAATLTRFQALIVVISQTSSASSVSSNSAAAAAHTSSVTGPSERR